MLIEGRDGSLHLDPFDAELRHVTLDGTVTVLKRYEGAPNAYQAAFDSCIADFAAAIRHGRSFLSPGADNLIPWCTFGGAWTGGGPNGDTLGSGGFGRAWCEAVPPPRCPDCA